MTIFDREISWASILLDGLSLPSERSYERNFSILGIEPEILSISVRCLLHHTRARLLDRILKYFNVFLLILSKNERFDSQR